MRNSISSYILLALMMVASAYLCLPQSFAENPQWGLVVKDSVSTNLYRYSDTKRSFDDELTISPYYIFNEKLSSSLRLSVDKSFSGTQNLSLSDSTLGFGYSGSQLNSFTAWSLASEFTLPTSKQSRLYDNLITAITLAPSLSLDLKQWKLAKLSPSYSLSLTKAFHAYKTGSGGAPLKEYNVKQIFDLSYDPIVHLDFDLYYLYANSWTYQGTRSTSFGLGQSIGYKFSPQLRWSVGHDNGGAALKSNGQESNIGFINPDASSVYTSLKYRF